MDEPEIRILSELDVEDFRRLRLRALKEEPESFTSAYEESLETPIADWAGRLRSSDESFVLGAFNPELVGMVGFFRRQGIKARHKGTIWGMYVAPEGRGKRIGQALLLAAIAHASSIPDLEELMLAVGTNNVSARNLYLAVGFQPYGIEKGALKLGDRLLDEELLALKLPARTN